MLEMWVTNSLHPVHHHLLLSLHHGLLVLSHHIHMSDSVGLLMHLNLVLNWVEGLGVSSVSCLVLIIILLHLLEHTAATLLGTALLVFQHFDSLFVSIGFGLFNLELENSQLSFLDGQGILLIVIGWEG